MKYKQTPLPEGYQETLTQVFMAYVQHLTQVVGMVPLVSEQSVSFSQLTFH